MISKQRNSFRLTTLQDELSKARTWLDNVLEYLKLEWLNYYRVKFDYFTRRAQIAQESPIAHTPLPLYAIWSLIELLSVQYVYLVLLLTFYFQYLYRCYRSWRLKFSSTPCKKKKDMLIMYRSWFCACVSLQENQTW